jgi:hypothetical protein
LACREKNWVLALDRGTLVTARSENCRLTRVALIGTLPLTKPAR